MPQFDVSVLALLFILIGALLLAGVLMILPRLAAVLLHKSVYQEKWQRYFPVFSFVAWISYACFAVIKVFSNETIGGIIVAAILFCVIMWGAYFFLREIMAGLLVKMRDDHLVGEIIQYEEFEGRILRRGHFALEVEQQDARVLVIPYSQLVGAIHVHSRINQQFGHHSFNIKVAKYETLLEIKQALRTAVLNTPWASLAKEPQIRLIEESEHHYLLEIVAYALNPVFFPHIEDELNTRFAKLKA